MCSRDGCTHKTRRIGLSLRCTRHACMCSRDGCTHKTRRIGLSLRCTRHAYWAAIPNSEFLIRELLQLPEYLEGLVGLDPLLEHDPIVGGEDPADALGVAFFVTSDVGAK